VIPVRLAAADAVRYARLRGRMLREAPWAFDATLEDDPLLDPAHAAAVLADPRGATFAIASPGVEPGGGGDDAQSLVAAASVTRAERSQFAHRCRVWGVYVEPSRRGEGLGRAVVGATLEHARSWSGVDWVDIGVSERSPEAQHLYERLGFVQWGREPETTAFDGRRYDEIFMALRIPYC
jgi:RimJ/RimL family protein N-acetyltransferase